MEIDGGSKPFISASAAVSKNLLQLGRKRSRNSKIFCDRSGLKKPKNERVVDSFISIIFSWWFQLI